MNDSCKTTWSSAEDLVGKLKIGDLVEFKRCASSGVGLYNHWGVYMGFENGIHGIGHVSSTGNLIKKSEICVENLFDVSEGGDCRINNSMDILFDPSSENCIKSVIKNKLGDHTYNLLVNNCEHFAKMARYGMSVSGQANNAVALLGAVAVFAFTLNPLTSIAAGGCLYCISFLKDITFMPFFKYLVETILNKFLPKKKYLGN
uniref:LRAT domain-containing protein n=1 Tax=Strongyloides venezuelensis TaxID=75913 RepID=A0A0K0EUU6_STRVS